MTLSSLKILTEENANLLKIGFSDGSSLYIKDFYLNYYIRNYRPQISHESSWEKYAAMEIGAEISAGDEEAFRFTASCYRAEHAGIRLIARAEQTRTGLSFKLEAKGHDRNHVMAVMDWFVQTNLVNDERYAERWLRSRSSRKSGKINGPRRLSAALGSKGINRDDLKNAFEKILDEEAEYSLLERFLVKNRKEKFSGAYNLKGYLRYEGFTSTVINRYLEESAGEQT